MAGGAGSGGAAGGGGMDGAAGIAGAAKGGGIGGVAGGGEAGGGAGEPTAEPLAGPRITRVNSPGASDEPKGVASGLFIAAFRGSRLSVKPPGPEAGTGGGAGGGAAGGGVLEAGGVPPPKIRVNSPGAPFAVEDPGSEVIGDSTAGVARGLRNNRVNSPGSCLSDARGNGVAAAGVAIDGGSLGWLLPPRPNR
jgi:hypothetical protein